MNVFHMKIIMRFNVLMSEIYNVKKNLEKTIVDKFYFNGN